MVVNSGRAYLFRWNLGAGKPTLGTGTGFFGSLKGWVHSPVATALSVSPIFPILEATQGIGGLISMLANQSYYLRTAWTSGSKLLRALNRNVGCGILPADPL